MGLQNKCKVNNKLSLCSKIVLTMLRLKTNLTFKQIAVLFQLSSSCVAKNFKRLSPLLALVLHSGIQWWDKDVILNNMPKCFEKFNDVRVVLDCTEFPVERSHCQQCRIITYSQYKHGHTIKLLVGVTPGCLIVLQVMLMVDNHLTRPYLRRAICLIC